MGTMASVEARLAWMLLFSGEEGLLKESPAGYGYSLEEMDAEELFALMRQIQDRLQVLGLEDKTGQEPRKLYIDTHYTIRLDAPAGLELPLRPLVKALFILFLKHPEGIILKQRDNYRQELENIYGVIAPAVSREVICERIKRLVDLSDNSFSEKASVLNARLDSIFGPKQAMYYKIKGANGHPRSIPLDPLLVEWK